ncbi:MAG: hypothetical protein NUV47_01705 [Patescibacteria group bacterium]|nr:hypothetical protein [Patescibacteria group bacterium]
MKNKALAIILGMLMFFSSGHYVYAEEVSFVSFFLNPFKIIIKKIDEKKENKEINKNIRNEIIEKQTKLRMEDIAERIDSRIKKIEIIGIDLSEAKKELSLAKENISTTTPISTESLIFIHDSLGKTLQLINETIH